MEIPPIFAAFVLAFFVGTGIGIAVLWEYVNSYRDRKAIQRVLRRVEDAERARKGNPDKAVPKPGVWDREMDRSP
jgi:hypothetical protein